MRDIVLFLALYFSLANGLSVPGNSSFDAQINRILHWDGLHQTNLGIGPSAIAAAAIGVGLAVTFYGFRLIRPVIFIAGFIIGAVCSFIGAELALKSQPYVVTACWVAFVFGGVVCGLLLVCMYRIGLVGVGALAGALVATVLHTSFGYKLYPQNPQVVLITLVVVLSIAFGILAFVMERPFVIFSTSALGAVMVSWGIGYFAGGYPNATNLPTSLDAVNIPTSWWGYVLGTFLLCVLGMYFQFLSTAPPPKERKRYVGLRGNPFVHC
ncbi:hypothetical protein ACHHYP_14720 [Achlya hypogyna]|uniref:Transmembrane protein 198 n=1 Tax=Achlya hypogyna TaxID=1202772 RepID=A0A1V9YCH7_ACHHY|nr:hypothetical protein ACHHYP_14720 [Achlya hypogyna]